MAKREIAVAFNEKTGKFAVEMSGYEGKECANELARLVESLRVNYGVDLKVEDLEFKPPKIPDTSGEAGRTLAKTRS